MFKQLGKSLLSRKEELVGEEEKLARTERILGRHLARELTAEEVETVAGGDPGDPGEPPGGPCTDEDYDKCISTFPSGDCDCYA